MVAAGDLQLGAGLTADPLAPVTPLLDGDLRFANLEGVFTRGCKADERHFAFDPARAAWLRGRLDVVSLANNHALDCGAAGRDASAAELRAAGIAAAFDGHDALVMPRRRRVVVIARAYAPDADLDAAAPELVAAVERARREGVVIVSLHWGHTGLLLPSPEQRRLAARLVDAGAVALLGHGPHTLMPVERRGRAVIAYSLGNLAFGCDCTDVADAIALAFTLGADGGARDVVLHPLRAGLQRPVSISRDLGLLRQMLELENEVDTRADQEGDTIRIR